MGFNLGMGLALASEMNAKLISLPTAYDMFCYFILGAETYLQLRVNQVKLAWQYTRGASRRSKEKMKNVKTKSVKVPFPKF